ncbi:MAG: undecaprenyl-phosphate glucose phosphotransferase, partial [Woeseia sp.]
PAASPRSYLSTRRLLVRNQPMTHWLQWLANGLAVVGLLYVIAVAKSGLFGEHYRALAVITVALMAIVYPTIGVFSRFSNGWSGMARIALVWFVTIGLVMLLGFVTKTSDHFSRQIMLTWFVVALAAQCGIHLLAHAVSRAWQLNRNMTIPSAVIGSGWLARHLTQRINHNVFIADQIVGVIDDPGAVKNWHVDEAPVLGDLDNLEATLTSGLVDRVYIALPIERAGEVGAIQQRLLNHNIDVIWVPDIFSMNVMNPSIREMAGMPLIALSESPQTTGARAYLKSLMDVSGAIIALVLLSPVLLALAAAIKMTSRGPVFYRQTRTGWDGGPFEIWKFRTMVVHDEGSASLTQAKKGDARVTSVGRFMRRTSLDELPQLFNVLAGTMSLVGPRPHSVIHDHEYCRQIDAYLLRHRMKPGMTGLAQVRGLRGQTLTVEAMANRVESDLEYIDRWSLKLDLWILIRTPFALFSKTAY